MCVKQHNTAVVKDNEHFITVIRVHIRSYSYCTLQHCNKDYSQIHRDAYHYHLIPMIPYKAAVESAACLGGVVVLTV